MHYLANVYIITNAVSLHAYINYQKHRHQKNDKFEQHGYYVGFINNIALSAIILFIKNIRFKPKNQNMT